MAYFETGGSAVNVSIKDLGIPMEVKTRGIELDVKDKDKHLGDLVVTKSGVIWCRGRTSRENGRRLGWRDFIALMEK